MKFSENILSNFNELKTLLKNEKVKWVNFNQFHLTLKFLGNTDSSLIPEINKSLENISGNFQPFSIHFKGYGVFRNFSNIKVIWMGLEKSNDLINLYKAIDSEMENLSFEKEKRDFNPHLTLCRIKFLNNRKKLIDFILRNQNISFQHFEIKEFFLIESILKETGPTYINMRKFNLSK